MLQHNARLIVIVLLVLFVVLSSGGSSTVAGTLDGVRSKVRNGTPKANNENRQKKTKRDDDDDDEGSSIVGTLASAAFQAATKPKPKKEKPQRVARSHSRPSQRHDHHRETRRPDRSPRFSGFVSFAPPIQQQTVVVYESTPAYVEPVCVEPVYADPVYRGQPYNAPPTDSGVVDPAYLPSYTTDSSLNMPPAEPTGLPPEPMPSVGQAWTDSVELPSPTTEILLPAMAWSDQWNARFRGIYGGDFDQLSQFGFDFLAVADRGFGIDTSLNIHWEELSPFNRDHLWFGDVNLVYELVHSPTFKGRAGVGMNWMADSIGGEAGLNLTFGFDWQLIECLIFTGEFDLGTLGDADHFHTRATLGYAISENVEWFAAYDHRDIGGVKIDGVATGLGFRF